MGFSLALRKKGKMRKLVGNYVHDRIKEKTAFNRQIELLQTQLRDKQIDQQTYERLIAIIETQYYQRQQL